MLSTNFLNAQTWPPAGQPSQSCGDIYFVSSSNANGDLEIAVNYHFKSTNPIVPPFEMSSLKVALSDYGTQGLTPNLTNALPNANVNLSGGTVPTINYSSGAVTYFASNKKGFHYNPVGGIVSLFTVTYLNNIAPYQGGCATFTYSTEMNVLSGGSCPPSSFIVGGTPLGISPNPALDAYKFCSTLQPSQLITISGNVSVPPLAKNTCIDPKGKPYTPAQTGLLNVDIAISDTPGAPYCSGTTTDAAGDYTSCAVPTQTYKLKASKKCPTGPYNGCLSTADIVQISKHSNAVVLFTQPWQFIAGDVNNDGAVIYDATDATSDSEKLRQSVLGVTPLSRCWEFYPKSSQNQYVLAAASIPNTMQNLFIANGNSWSQDITVTSPTANVTGQDFYGVQVGDVNGSCYCSGGLMKPSKEEVKTETFFSTVDVKMKANSSTVIPFLNQETKAAVAFDIALTLDANVEFEGLSSTLVGFDENAYHWDNETRTLRIIWLSDNKKGTLINKGQALFNLKLKANESTKVSEAMSIDQYNENILFGIDTEAKIGIELSESTVLATNDNIYSLPKDMIGELSVYDIYGRVVVNQIANTSEINVLLDEIAVTNGMYIYRFEAKNTHFSRKFVYNH